jgi:undecaprenyl-diphosphatase
VALPVAGLLTLMLACAVLRLHFRSIVDDPVTLALNRLARRSMVLDYAVQLFVLFNLFQSVPLFALVYGLFVALKERAARIQLLTGCAAAAGAAAISRGLQLFLPRLDRPIFDSHLQLVLPLGSDANTPVRDWSSFPSDHAALLFGVACAVWLVNRRLGWVGFLLAATCCFARVYAGLHFVTDVVGGAALGCAMAVASQGLGVGFAKPIADACSRWPALAAGFAFLLASQASAMFEDARQIAAAIYHHLL